MILPSFLRPLVWGGLAAVLFMVLPAHGQSQPGASADPTTPRVVQPGAPGEPVQVLMSGTATEAPRVVQPGAPGEATRVLVDGTEPSVRIVRPGAPGEPSRVHHVRAVQRSGEPTYAAADVSFMQKMILHHAQALQMTALVEERAARDAILQMAGRIERSQMDEIATMMNWLEERDEAIPALPPDVAPRFDETGTAESPAHGEHASHERHDHSDMAGMLSPEELDELAAASGEAFDRLFLESMIYHHRGAITMVDALFRAPDGGQETGVFMFASHVESDQQVEIRRMAQMLQSYR
jgi:uncharacterized protein (DUF305 family)